MRQGDWKELSTALDDPLPIVRMSAVQALGRAKETRALPKLIAILSGDISSIVRDNAAFVLGEIGDDKAVTALVSAASDADEWVRKSAIKALGMLRSSQSFDIVARSLSDNSHIVRKTACRTLGQFGDRRAVEHLRKLLSDSHIVVRKHARQALEKLSTA